MRYMIFYHSADFDGECSMRVIYKYIRSHDPDIEIVLRPINYGDEYDLSDIDYNTVVYMADFSMPHEDMVKIYNQASKFIWIDHHITAIEQSVEYKYDYYEGIRDIEYAACELCWKYCFPDVDMPVAVTLLGRYDVWQHQEGTREFQFGLTQQIDKIRELRSYGKEDKLWEQLLPDSAADDDWVFIRSIISVGKILHDYDRARNKELCEKDGYVIEFEGYRTLVYNSSNVYSGFFDDVYDVEDHDIMLKYGYNAEGKNWTCSVYTRKENIDVAAIAKKYGGGGHKGAAGFTIDTKQLDMVLLHE